MIMIKPSDKGGNIVVMDNNQYLNTCNKILSNRKWYSRISSTKINKFHEDFCKMDDLAYSDGTISKSD